MVSVRTKSVSRFIFDTCVDPREASKNSKPISSAADTFEAFESITRKSAYYPRRAIYYDRKTPQLESNADRFRRYYNNL